MTTARVAKIQSRKGPRCKGTTQQGTPCMRRALFENGYCAYHGGAGKSPEELAAERRSKKLARNEVDTQMERERLERFKATALRQAAAFNRKFRKMLDLIALTRR